MNSAHYRRLEYVYLMANDFEYIIAEEFCDPRVSFEDFRLGLLVAAYYDDSCVIGEHHVELIRERLVSATRAILYLVLIEQGLSTAGRACLHYEFFAFCYIIFNLNQIVAVELEGLRVIRIDSLELPPEVIDPLRVVNDVETQLVQDVEVDHGGFEVRPELNVVVCTLLYFLI